MAQQYNNDRYLIPVLNKPRKESKKQIEVKCTNCNKKLIVWLSKYEKAHQQFHGHIFCSRKCSRKHQPRHYDTFNWCDSCKYIKKIDTIIIKHNNRFLYYCPKCRAQIYPSNRSKTFKSKSDIMRIESLRID